MDDFEIEVNNSNILVIGRTGAGKSTLINSIFGEEVAATGRGAPVTPNFDFFPVSPGAFGLYDSRGFELGQTGPEIARIVDEQVGSQWDKPTADQIALAWLVYRIPPPRAEREDIQLVETLRRLGIQVIVVITNVTQHQGSLHTDHATEIGAIRQLFAPHVLGVCATNSLAAPATPEVFGHDELVDLTVASLPEAQRAAFVIGQKINRARKAAIAQEWTRTAAGKAFAAGAQPVPLLDDWMLHDIVSKLVRRLCQLYALEPSLVEAVVLGALGRANLISNGKAAAAEFLRAALDEGAGEGLTAIARFGARFRSKIPDAAKVAKGNVWLAVATAVVFGSMAAALVTAVGRAVSAIGARNLTRRYASRDQVLKDFNEVYKAPGPSEFEKAAEEMADDQFDASNFSDLPGNAASEVSLSGEPESLPPQSADGEVDMDKPDEGGGA